MILRDSGRVLTARNLIGGRFCLSLPECLLLKRCYCEIRANCCLFARKNELFCLANSQHLAQTISVATKSLLYTYFRCFDPVY